MYNKKDIEITQNLLESILKKDPTQSLEKTKSLFTEIFSKRFADDIDKNGILRYKSLSGPEDNIQYWGVLYDNAPPSGVYENFSLVLFPDNTEEPKQLLLCYGIGTGGITDDAEWLSIPWVKRSIKLLLKLVEKEDLNVKGTEVFVKDDITDEYTEIPDSIRNNLGNFSNYTELWRKYGKYLPSVCLIEPNDAGAKAFLHHLLLYSKFRNWPLRSKYQQLLDNELFPNLINLWRDYPSIENISKYLLQRKYIILQGPPGTGKTYLAQQIAEHLKEKGKITDYKIVQFHASVSYEDFVEGIKPDTNSNQLIFKEHKGPLLESIEEAEKAKREEKGYLLIIDEINRGDLAKILGEAIFLFEPNEERSVKLKSGRKITMPKDLYVIGTMNTADRTIAILDFAIRRRFAFIDVWPSRKKLEEILGNKNTKELALKYYDKIQNIFFKYATDEELHLQPGHTYFIASSEEELKNRLKSEEELKNRLKYEVVPLLQEYLTEGRLSIAKNEILALIDEIQRL